MLVDESDTLIRSVALEAFELVIETYTVAESIRGAVVEKVWVSVAVTESLAVFVKVNESSASKATEEVVTIALL